jgi:3-dehydroquinate synthase
VVLGLNALSELPKWMGEIEPTRALIIFDSNVGPLYASGTATALERAGWKVSGFSFRAGEQSKTLATASRAFEVLAEIKMPRDGIVVALGGGVVSDLAGFVASTWMRGIRWINCPTTMEADVDACLGGKTAVNLPAGKNLVGVFHDPTMVVVDPDCLSTLPRRDVCAGLAEAVKHALLQSNDELAWLETNAEKILTLDPLTICELIERNLRFKGRIVTDDPHETTGRRILLNFGHTIGHAIEKCAKGDLRHGECVALGMVAACHIAQRAGLIGDETVQRINALLAAFELPTRLDLSLDRGALLESILLDKKAAGGKVRLVLLQGVGAPVIRNDIAPDWIAEAFDSLT